MGDWIILGSRSTSTSDSLRRTSARNLTKVATDAHTGIDGCRCIEYVSCADFGLALEGSHPCRSRTSVAAVDANPSPK